MKIGTSHFATATLVLLTMLSASGARAQDQYVQQLLAQLEAAAYPFASAGYYGILGECGALGHQTYQDFRVTLNAGSDYAVLGVCDEDCYDLDVALYNLSGNLIVADSTEDAAPLVPFTVTESGSFTLRVTMYNCGVEPCYYGVGVYER